MRIVRSEKIDVLHAHWVIPQGLTAIIVGWLTNTPVVTTCHAADMYALRGRFRNMLKRWVLNRCQYFTAVNHQLVEEARALGVRMQTPSSVIS
ncbi:MAG: glycosyltransferase, partial [Chloroflexi bacterium]|nr:glycosyltransferase [Chloroflexota bacterium]